MTHSLEIPAYKPADTAMRFADFVLALGLLTLTALPMVVIAILIKLEDRGPDYIEAHKWFNLAAMMGSQPAKAYRDEIGREMKSNEVTLALKAARGWLRENRKRSAPKTRFA